MLIVLVGPIQKLVLKTAMCPSNVASPQTPRIPSSCGHPRSCHVSEVKLYKEIFMIPEYWSGAAVSVILAKYQRFPSLSLENQYRIE